MKLYFILFFLTGAVTATSQNTGAAAKDINRIALNIYVPESDKVPTEVRSYLVNKLGAIASLNGLGGIDTYNPRFVLSANIQEINKEQLSESVLFYYNLELNLYVVDAIENTLFNAATISVKGAGNTSEKAYIDALKRVEPRSNNITSFLEKAKAKIIDFYTTQCDFIQQKAQTLGKENRYDEALYELEMVPEVCTSCFQKTQENIIGLYKDKIEFECSRIMLQAKALIAKDNYDEAATVMATIFPNTSCFQEAKDLLKVIRDHRCSISLGKARGAWATYNLEEAGQFLSEVPADSKCRDEALQLANEIKKYAKEKDRREWNLTLKIQNDEVVIRKSAIEAAKAIGIAYAKSQPRTLIYHNLRTLW